MNPDTNKSVDYESNPFKLAFAAMKRLFNTNRGWAIALIIIGVLSAFSSNNSSSDQSASQGSLTATGTENTVALVVFIVSMVAIIAIGLLIVGTYVQGMLSYVALQSEKGKKVSVSEAYKAVGQRFWRLLGAQLLAAVKVIGWSLLFVIPGIIAAVRYALLSYVIMDESPENKSVKESHDRTKSLVKTRLWEVLGVSMTAIVPVVGGLLDTAGKAAQYNQLKHYHDSKLEKPKIHWLNYLIPLIFIFAIVALAIALVAFAISQTS